MQTFDERRRRFLTCAGPGMVWLSTAGLAACGGGGDPDNAGTGVGNGGGSNTGGSTGGGTSAGGGTSVGGTITVQQRAATLQAVSDAVARLSAGSDGFDSSALVREMQSIASLVEVGQSARVGNVWARFSDGRWLVVPNNLRGLAPTGSAQDRSQQAARARPKSTSNAEFDTPAILVARQYRQLDMLGQVPIGSSVDAAHLCLDFVDATTLPNLRKMAVGRGFVLPEIQATQPVDVGIDNGVRGLADVRGDGVFFITAPAAQGGDDATPYTLICTDTPGNEANLAAFEPELSAGALAYAIKLRGVDGAWQAHPCLAMSAQFVRTRAWRFPAESIGIFNLSGAPELSDWIPVLEGAGLRHVLGWRQAVSWQRLLAFADDLIQFNLATNNLEGRLVRQAPEPRLRAYGMADTLGHLIDRGLTGGRDAVFYLQERQPSLFVNTILPTIERALIRETRGELELNGQFGARAWTDDVVPRIAVARTEGQRFAEPLLWRAADPPLGGNETLRDPLWQGQLLQTVLDGRDPLERGGYVQVFNGGRCSNVVPITHWEIPIQAVTSVDELTLAVTITIRLRADVHGWRLGPEGSPRNGFVQTPLEGSVHSSARFSASGSISQFDSVRRTLTTVSWLGSGSIGNAIGAFLVYLNGTLWWDSRRLAPLAVGVGGGTAFQQRTVVEEFDINGVLLRRNETTVDLPVTAAAAGAGPNGEFAMSFDPDWNLMSGQFEALPAESDLLPTPAKRLQRTRLSWPLVRPDFAPRLDYGGT